jgi:RNA polymerase-binding transcription factor DksA
MAKKPEVKLPMHKPLPVYQPKPSSPSAEAIHKPAKSTHTDKPFVESATKHTEKMSEKKDKKPVAMATMPEEPQKTRYSDKELAEFDQLIDEKLIVAREQLEFYLKQLEDMAENPDNKIKSLDDGLSSLESERISSMASRQQKLIQHLENAKIRIKNKVYGICRETGKLISKERLRAVPHATLSIEAKQAQN